MNKTLAITSISFVAIVLAIGSVAPADGHNVTEKKGPNGSFVCPDGWGVVQHFIPGSHPDHNMNGKSCVTPGGAQVDDRPFNTRR